MVIILKPTTEELVDAITASLKALRDSDPLGYYECLIELGLDEDSALDLL
jgi:hypothetical protein